MWDLVTRDYSKHLNGPQVFEIVKRYVRKLAPLSPSTIQLNQNHA